MNGQWSIVIGIQQKGFFLEEVFPLKVFWVEALPDENFQVEVFPLDLSDKQARRSGACYIK